MKRILTIVGARPQFIKSNIVSKKLELYFQEILVHTGQHYDSDMSDIFFDELKMTKPKYNLGVGSNTHAKQTAEIMIKLEKVIENENPDAILVYGDTNSTLAGALVAAKMNIPIFHIEGGVRTHCKDMPEEQNRILTDHLSDLIFLSTEENLNDAISEGLQNRSFVVGDIMYDSLKHYTTLVENNDFFYMLNELKPLYNDENKIKNIETYYLFTLHRPENTDSIEKIKKILDVIDQLGILVIFSVHPRIKNIIRKIYKNYKKIYFVQPLSYLQTLYFSKKAKKIVTDSGGLHKEAYLHGVPCVTLLRGGWSETVHDGWNHFVNIENLKDAINNNEIKWDSPRNEFGDGNATEKIVKIMLEYFQESGKC
ncbi:MAG: UDP-N-acetylglucosamine 2-epimerase (non-hydrolyzing) [Fusobacterium sp.]|uniref:non-hydrolyzing UDP-N-acetylglucosamine 2-epimerase n=1 Tax=Fusobacterium sp. TaxID=68766 RepID=UPI0026DAF83E|nr:UDP-N-acetylglucosamine 2-epimerase (non-hydrolyzing) [Fusobacterium sp.]MDO4690247.1 UDP-N-acetylglucosamine 2-epimerase (non-hydrolyzing) [Fusobacterium sp.]